MIRLPSIRIIISNASATIRRFPLVLTFAVLGTFSVIWLVDLPWDQREGHYMIRNFSWITALSISLFLAVKTADESSEWNSLTLTLNRVGAFILLAILYLLLPENFEPSNTEIFLNKDKRWISQTFFTSSNFDTHPTICVSSPHVLRSTHRPKSTTEIKSSPFISLIIPKERT